MKTSFTKLASLTLASTLALSLLSTAAIAGNKHKQDVDKHIVKVIAESGEDVSVFVNEDGDKQTFVFTTDQLEDMDQIKAELSGLDQESQTKVLEVIEKLGSLESNFIEIRDADIEIGDAETEVFVIKTGDNEDSMHIEIDVEGDGAHPDNKFHIAKFIGEGRGANKVIRHQLKGKGKHAAKMVKKLIKKGEFTQEQLDDIRAMIDAKEPKTD